MATRRHTAQPRRQAHHHGDSQAHRPAAPRVQTAKAKIKAAHIPYRVPSTEDVREWLAGVLAVVFLIFNEGYLAGAADDPLRADPTDEAIRLGGPLRALLREDGEVTGTARPHAARTLGVPRESPGPASW